MINREARICIGNVGSITLLDHDDANEDDVIVGDAENLASAEEMRETQKMEG